MGGLYHGKRNDKLHCGCSSSLSDANGKLIAYRCTFLARKLQIYNAKLN